MSEHFQNPDITANLKANPDLGQHVLVQSIAQLMQAQTNILTAHAQAVAMLNLPALPSLAKTLKEMMIILRSGWSCLKGVEDLFSD